MSDEKNKPWMRLHRVYKAKPGQQTWPLREQKLCVATSSDFVSQLPTIKEELSPRLSIDQKLDKISRVISRFEQTLRACGFSSEELKGIVESDSLEQYFNDKLNLHLKLRKLTCYCNFRKKVMDYGHYVYYFRFFRIQGVPFQLFCDYIDENKMCKCDDTCSYCNIRFEDVEERNNNDTITK